MDAKAKHSESIALTLYTCIYACTAKNIHGRKISLRKPEAHAEDNARK